MPRKGKVKSIPDISLAEYLWGKCLNHGQKVAIVDSSEGGKSLTFKEIYDLSRNCAAFLHSTGAKIGDFIGICAASSLEYAIAMLGISGTGATLAHCNPAFKEGEILQQFSISKPKMVIVHEAGVETMKKVQEKLSCLETIFVIGKSDEFTTFDSMCKMPGDMSYLKGLKINQSEDIAVLPYSSGTTGLPKSVILTHENMVAVVYSCCENMSWYEEGSVMYTDRPMYHGGGFITLFACLSHGLKLVMEKEFEIVKMLETIEKYKVTHVGTVPPIMIDLVNADNTEHYDTSSVVAIFGVGASMAPDIRRRLQEKFNVAVIAGYGMTECATITTGGYVKNDFSSVGRICLNMEIKIIDLETSVECAVGSDGEILVRGPQVTKGYLKNPEANANTFEKDGWMHTGDIGHFDKDGRLYIVDRLKEVIKYKGLQVPPAELEAVLLQHPKIMDVGVIGIPDPHDGELPKAFVVKKDDNLTNQEVEEFAKSELVEYKHLRGGVEFVLAIPKSATGKIQRQELKKMAGIKV